jgi:stage II sporulation protein Q
MKKRKLKKPVIYMLYGLAGIALIASIYFVEKAFSNALFKPQKDDYEYVDGPVIDDDIPVVSTGTVILRPYNSDKIQVVKGYYDYKGEPSVQEKALIFYQDTYLQNSGIVYGSAESFDDFLGKIVEVKHSNDMMSIYQSLSEVTVKKNDVIKQGDIIGKSGKSSISSEMNENLYFELFYKGSNVNPDEYYDKKVEEL